MVFEVPFVMKERATVQAVDLSSFQEATRSEPILSSFPETVTDGPAMTFTEAFATVMVGAVVSFSGVGGVGSTGVTGVGGVGSTGSSPPQAARSDSARSQGSILIGGEKILRTA